MIRARQTTAGILSELDNMQLEETGILEVMEDRTPYPETRENELDLAYSPLKSKSYPLLESVTMAEGPPPIDPEPQSSSFLRFSCR